MTALQKAHDLMIWVVNLSDRMEPEEIAAFTGSDIQDVLCMIVAYDSTGDVDKTRRDVAARMWTIWAPLVIRRYLVSKLCYQYSDRGIAERITDICRCAKYTHRLLTHPSKSCVTRDRIVILHKRKYALDHFTRIAA